MRGVEFRLLSPLAGVWTPRVTPELQSLGRRPSGWSRLLSVREVAARLGSAPRRPTSSAPKESSSTQGSRTRFVSRKRFFEPIARDSGPGSGPSTSRNPAWSIIGMAASFVTAASRRCAGRPRTSRRDQTYWAASARGLDGFPWIELAGARITSRTNLGLERMGIDLKRVSAQLRHRRRRVVAALGGSDVHRRAGGFIDRLHCAEDARSRSSSRFRGQAAPSHRLHPALRAPDGWARQLLEVVDQEIDERPRRSLRPAPGGK